MTVAPAVHVGRFDPWQCALRSKWCLCVAIAWLMLPATPAAAQDDNPPNLIPRARRTAPSDTYFNTFPVYYDGDYKDSLKLFLREGRGAIKTAQSRWIDSICYHAMTGETYYQMGRLNEALEHYTSALELFTAYSGWMIRVQFNPINPAVTNQRPVATWGVSQRGAPLGHYPHRVLIGQGRINNNDQIRQGGVVQQAVAFPATPQEIVRCTTIAQRRRRELMGPACEHDQLTKNVLAALVLRPAQPNHWSECWIDVQLGLAYLSAGKEAQAKPVLERSLLAAGQFDHPLTATALFELGKLELAAGNFEKAGFYFEETTYSAAQFLDPGLLEEAFRYAALTHIVANRRGVYAPLENAAGWARIKRYRRLQVSLMLSAAEIYATQGNPDGAAKLLEEAKAAAGNRDMMAGRLGARYYHESALVHYQRGDVAKGDEALRKALAYMNGGSHRLFQIQLADSLYSSSLVTPRISMELYDHLLREPSAVDWSFEPLESLATLVVPHPRSYENWFRVALQRDQRGKGETAIDVAELARRHRFFSSLEMGGRLLSLRWLLEGPSELLDRHAAVQRGDLLAQFPRYQQLLQESTQIRAQLDGLPLVNEDAQTHHQQSELMNQLDQVSRQKEIVLREIAVRRMPGSMVFPPQRTAEEVRQSLPEKHALLGFYATREAVYGMLLSGEDSVVWQIGTPNLLQEKVARLLRELGHAEANRVMGEKQLDDAAWKRTSSQLLDLLLRGKEGKTGFPTTFEEVVIVPDSVLWYVPFGALQVVDAGNTDDLFSRLRIRLAPTMGLAVGDPRGRRQAGRTAVVVGRLFPRDAPEVTQLAFDELSQVVPGAVALRQPMPANSALFSSLFDGLIVLDDITSTDDPAYDWSVLELDKGSPGSELQEWFALPFGGPASVILPGFHTAAENSLKRSKPADAGDEVFQTVMGLMSTGAQTMLLSSWRTGGQTSFDLVREFALELPHSTAAEAWQRSVLLARNNPLQEDLEPRLDLRGADNPPLATHPFFWSGYLLIDTGTAPHKIEDDAGEDVVLQADE